MAALILSVLVAVVLVLVAIWCDLVTRGPTPPSGKRLPPVVRGLPIIGPAIPFSKAPYQFAEAQYKKLKSDVFSLCMFNQRITFLVGPSASSIFFKGDDKELSQDEPYAFAVPIFGPGVVYDVPLDIRIQQFKLLGQSLRTSQLRSYTPQIVEEASKFFEEWGPSGEVNTRDVMSDLIIRTASRTLMGKEIRDRLHGEVWKLFLQLDEGLTSFSVAFPNAPIPAHKRRDAARLRLVEIFGAIMAERRANPEVKHDDALASIMSFQYKDKRYASDVEVTGFMIAMLFAGQHTSSITSSWTILRLVQPENAKFLQRVLEEQEAVRKEFGDDLTFDALAKMEYLHVCIKEALRLHPPLIYLMRKTKVDFVHEDIFIPKGDTLFVSPTINGRLESVFKNADVYDPDRFLEPRSEDKAQPFAFIGFGGGRHECMGQQFAFVQIKTILSTLFRTFKLEAVGPLPKTDYAAMVVGPEHHNPVKYTRIIA